jgi:hypothetical protein
MGERDVMKRVAKSDEPNELIVFRKAQPSCDWEGMRNDALNGGMQAYDAIVSVLEADQGGICAYCERAPRKLLSGLDSGGIMAIIT